MVGLCVQLLSCYCNGLMMHLTLALLFLLVSQIHAPEHSPVKVSAPLKSAKMCTYDSVFLDGGI